MFILFDDCAFSGKQPYIGKQPSPVKGVHNSGWTPSPGFDLALHPKRAPELEAYVKDIIGEFSDDERILVWDLYNEPGNSNLGDRTMWLVESAFLWARELNPIQPLTTGAWGFQNNIIETSMNLRMFDLSDVISFHYYKKPENEMLHRFLEKFKNRPILCTEWLFRQNGNTFESMLPIFNQCNVGWYIWGLVAGRTQTFMHWGSKKG